MVDTEISGEKDLLTVVKVNALGKSNIVTCKQADIYKGGKLSMSMSWILEDPDEEACAKYMLDFESKMAEVFSASFSVLPQNISHLHRAEIEEICLGNNTAFIDASFLPNNDSLFKVCSPRIGANSSPSAELEKKKTIIWRRPQEFLAPGASPVIFDGEIEPNDIKQGQLGDCWLLCAFAAVAEFPELVKALFPEGYNTPSEAGVYKVRINKNGLWEEIFLDDFFPCFAEGGPIYSRAHEHELWVLILEKAFAKLNGSYASIRSGWPFEALIDLTGKS